MIVDVPYFMTNKDWYTFDAEKWRFVLTDKAPKEAAKSLEEFYAAIDDGSDREES